MKHKLLKLLGLLKLLKLALSSRSVEINQCWRPRGYYFFIFVCIICKISYFCCVYIYICAHAHTHTYTHTHTHTYVLFVFLFAFLHRDEL